MITLHILKLLEDNGFGTLALTGAETADKLLFWEKLPQGKEGVYIISNGAPVSRGGRMVQSFDLYCRGSNDIDSGVRLENIIKFFAAECYPVCKLPAVELEDYTSPQYANCSIITTSNITNVGEDDTDRVIFNFSAEVTYKEIN